MGPLGGDQQQLADHQGGFDRRSDALELGQAEKLEQAQVHNHTEGQGEPPAPRPTTSRPKAPAP
jgi:hypothetical protein